MYSYVWANLLVIKQAIRLLHLSVVIELRHYYTMDMPTDRLALVCLRGSIAERWSSSSISHPYASCVRFKKGIQVRQVRARPCLTDSEEQ